MHPPPWVRITRAAAWQAKKSARTLMSKTASHSSSVISSAGLRTFRPALLTRMSMRPNAPWTSRTSCCTSAAERASTVNAERVRAGCAQRRGLALEALARARGERDARAGAVQRLRDPEPDAAAAADHEGRAAVEPERGEIEGHGCPCYDLTRVPCASRPICTFGVRPRTCTRWGRAGHRGRPVSRRSGVHVRGLTPNVQGPAAG